MLIKFAPENMARSDDHSKVFNDSIHGTIELHPLCVKIIDTPQFQRLRFLKQLGLGGYLVYPAAAHNRFEHSLGVCHLAGLLVRSLKERQNELNITDKDVLCVEIAGLCHDLGHGPFSHLWEYFLEKTRPEKKWKHAEASTQMLDHLILVNNIWEDIGKYGLIDDDITFVKEMIAGPKQRAQHPSEWPYKGRPREKGFLYQIVADEESGVDVDKWDYIARDGHSLGLKVMFDYSRLVKFSRVINVPNEGFKICFRDKEVNNLYDMFHARMMLHRTAYQHKVAKTIDVMILDALIYADKHIKYYGNSGQTYSLSSVIDDPSAMTHLNDDVLQRIQRSRSDDREMREARLLVNNIFTRKLYLYVGHTVPTIESLDRETLLTELLNQLDVKTNVKKEDLSVQCICLNYGKESRNPMDCVKFYTKANIDKVKEHNIDEVSKMLPQRWEERRFIVLIRRYDESLRNEAAEAFSKACLSLNVPQPTE